MIEVQLVVLAKAPVAGRVKTRLSPALTPQQAADVAAAALQDTLATVLQVAVRRRVLVIDGDPKDIAPPGIEVLPQRGTGLGERLAAAFQDVAATSLLPILLLGMDTPQVSHRELVHAAELLAAGHPVLGHAEDGGWWAIGLERADPNVFLGVAMSTDQTGREQEARMRERGLTPILLPVLRDIDLVEDLRAVVNEMSPTSQLAGLVRTVNGLVPA